MGLMYLLHFPSKRRDDFSVAVWVWLTQLIQMRSHLQ